MELMMFTCVVVLLVSALLLGGGYALSVSGLSGCDKLSPFECGFSPRDSYRSFFSLDFFLVALVFLVFDLELVILFPYLFSGGLAIEPSFGCGGFILLLGGGLVYEWGWGSLEWTT
uniref:NADH-ubiquinone oxidoreductase chain 3 n=1 Tax=Pandarus rhincodonicus TaxID=1473543 RepID=A0A024J4N6_PANRH|nr:NADH dehydrogenase subunit 3 [Pandarus rhincodonicus]